MTLLTERELGNNEFDSAYDNLLSKGLVDYKTWFNENIDNLLEKDPSYDSYYLVSDMIDMFISNFPGMSDAWTNLSTPEKWIFTQGIHYGINSYTQQRMNDDTNI